MNAHPSRLERAWHVGGHQTPGVVGDGWEVRPKRKAEAIAGRACFKPGKAFGFFSGCIMKASQSGG